MEVLAHIKDKESQFPERWVPSVEINNQLGLKFVAVPKNNKPDRLKGWLLAIVARILEDKNLVEFKKTGDRSFYRSR